ncbi:hypothetical protein CSC2_45130 [Clostridium zeae]|uniref:LPXTG cell wall anchor domain-containing protein n=1 Tax=Clostridium zeae TaxID=2759022 RepID=A0ABQ1EGY4_9CLOT|nr:LPXTG cell wall anchor domain-containing protein [Clostridium zeae]GFZ33987.1 hypothetical protein CSC2_45130 [Clostridium zeae]
MRNKGKALIALIMAIIFQVCGIGFQPLMVNAADLTNTVPFITDLTLTDGSGNPLGSDVSKSSEVHINYKFSIPNTAVVKAGDTYTMKIPKQIQIIKTLNFDLVAAGSSEVVAKVNIDTSGNVVITFTDYASTHSNVSGYFYVDSYFNQSQIGNTNPEKIIFDIGASVTKVVDVNFHQDPVAPKTYITKTGSYNPSKNEVTWTITTNPDKLTLNDVEVVDEIPLGQQYVDNSATINNNGSASGFSYLANDSADRTKTGTLSYKFQGAINQSYNIVFKTKVTDPAVFQSEGAKTTESNQAKLNHDGKQDLSNVASVVVTTDFISKSGAYNSTTKTIDWSIKVNNNAQHLTNALVKDTIPAGLALTAGTVKVDGKNISDSEYDYSGSTFQYIFQGDINEPHTITFSTDIVDLTTYNSNKTKNFTNKVDFIGVGIPSNASDSAVVGVPSNIIDKQAAGYNAQTAEITWKIIVDNNKININNAVITDNIPTGQQYVDNSAGIDNNANGSFSYTPVSGDSTKTGILKYNFNGSINSTYTITFKTKVTDPKVFAANITNKSYSNTASISGDGIETSQDTANQNVNSEVIRKDGSNYNYATREATWTIVVNKNKMPINSAKVTDVITSGQEFVDGSVTINGVQANSSNYNYDSASKTFTYNFVGTINTTQTITLKTKVIDLSIFNTNGDKQISNTASLSGDIIPPNVSDPATITIKNTTINKTSSYVDGNSFIDWNIDVNSNQISLDTATVVDTLQQGLELDTTSVKLYKNIVNSDGTLTKSDEVALNQNSVKYDKDTRVFTFNFPAAVKDSYRLSFTTNVTDKTKSPFTNSATFTGSGSTDRGTSQPVAVRFQVAGGGSIGESGSIKVIKADKVTSTPIKGAVFELLDKYENVIKTSEPTTDDGIALFNNLKFDIDYSVREKTAPVGYKLSSEVYKFQVKNTTDEKNITYIYENDKIRGSIEFKKVGENGDPLKDAEYTLYKAEDGKFESPVAKDLSVDNGFITFSNVDYGDYKIKETKAPNGYTVSSQVLTASVRDEGITVQAAPYVVSDSKIRGNIEFYKFGEDNKPLKDAEFKIYSALDKELKTPLGVSTSSDTGLVSFKNLEYGLYNIVESKAPEGYSLYPQAIKAEIIEDGKTINPVPDNLINKKIRASIKVIKVGEQKEALEGAEFSLLDERGNLVASKVTDKDGIAEFDNVVYGQYIVKETKAKLGYNKIDDEYKVNITEDGKVYEVGPIENKKIRGSIEVKKLGEDDKLLKGAEFTLFDEQGKEVQKVLTDENGIARFSEVVYGAYTIKETKAPEGYLVNTEVLQVNISSSEVKTFTVKDQLKPVVKNTNDAPASNNNSVTQLVKTGALIDSNILVFLGLVVITLGVVMIRKRKNN